MSLDFITLHAASLTLNVYNFFHMYPLMPHSASYIIPKYCSILCCSCVCMLFFMLSTVITWCAFQSNTFSGRSRPRTYFEWHSEGQNCGLCKVLCECRDQETDRPITLWWHFKPDPPADGSQGGGLTQTRCPLRGIQRCSLHSCSVTDAQSGKTTRSHTLSS